MDAAGVGRALEHEGMQKGAVDDARIKAVNAVTNARRDSYGAAVLDSEKESCFPRRDRRLLASAKTNKHTGMPHKTPLHCDKSCDTGDCVQGGKMKLPVLRPMDRDTLFGSNTGWPEFAGTMP